MLSHHAFMRWTVNSHSTLSNQFSWKNKWAFWKICCFHVTSIAFISKNIWASWWVILFFIPFIPCYLPFRIVPTMLSYECDRLFESMESLEVFNYFSVADSRESRTVWTKFSHNILYFSYESSFEHFMHSSIYIGIEFCSIGITIWRDVEGSESGIFFALWCEFGFASLSDDLESPHHISIVTNFECTSIFGIDILEHIPEFLVSLWLSDDLEFLSIFPIGGSIGVSHLIEESVDIEASTTAEDRNLAYSMYLIYDRECHIDIVDYWPYIIRIDHIDHMMRDSSHFFWFDFTSSDIHISIYLSGVCRYDLALYILSYIEGEWCFATRSRSVDDYYFWQESITPYPFIDDLFIFLEHWALFW